MSPIDSFINHQMSPSGSFMILLFGWNAWGFLLTSSLFLSSFLCISLLLTSIFFNAFNQSTQVGSMLCSHRGQISTTCLLLTAPRFSSLARTFAWDVWCHHLKSLGSFVFSKLLMAHSHSNPITCITMCHPLIASCITTCHPLVASCITICHPPAASRIATCHPLVASSDSFTLFHMSPSDSFTIFFT